MIRIMNHDDAGDGSSFTTSPPFWHPDNIDYDNNDENHQTKLMTRQDDDDYIEDYGSSLTTCPPFWHLAHSFLPQTRPETKLPHSLIKICKAEVDRDFHDEDEESIVNEHEGGFSVMKRVSHFLIEAFLEELERRNPCVHIAHTHGRNFVVDFLC